MRKFLLGVLLFSSTFLFSKGVDADVLKMKNITKTVTTAGTRVQLTTAKILVPMVVIQALSGNTNPVFVGSTNVSSTLYFVRLAATNSVSITALTAGSGVTMVDLSSIWLDATTSAEGVNVGYMEQAPN